MLISYLISKNVLSPQFMDLSVTFITSKKGIKSYKQSFCVGNIILRSVTFVYVAFD